MDVGRLIRAVRYARRLSQRELADLAHVPPSTIGRIESGAADPRLSTILGLLRSTGYTFVIADQRGRLLEIDPDRDRLRDRGSRHFPAHLNAHAVTGFTHDWWGWSRIAWSERDPIVPSHTYYKRSRYRDWNPRDFWMDAT